MAADAPPVFVISGQLSAGKSTVARALLDRFEFGYHVDVDGIREMVTSGLASPVQWNEETDRQFALAIRGAAALARIYADAGFAVAIEGGIDAATVESALDDAGISDRVVGIVLHPPLEVALERNRLRQTKAFDTSVLEGVMREIDAELRTAPSSKRWHSLDNGSDSVSETVDRILGLVPKPRVIG